MKTFKEIQEDIEFEKTLDDLVEFKLISKAQRRKIALRMKRLVKTAGFKKKVERSKRKIANFAKQKVKAAKKAKEIVVTTEKIKTERTLRSRKNGNNNIGAAVILVANTKPTITPKAIPNRSRKAEE